MPVEPRPPVHDVVSRGDPGETKLGLALRDMGRPEEALRELRAVKQLNPSFLPGRIHLGVTLYSLGKLDEAVQDNRLVRHPGA